MQVEADGRGGVGVDGAVTSFDVPDDSVFVDDDVGAHGPLVSLALHIVVFENAVGDEHFLVHVAEQRKFDIDLFGEGFVRCRTIHADAENRRVVGIDLARVDSRLDRLELLRSTPSEGQHIDR